MIMHSLIRIIAILSIATGLTLTGCSREESPPDSHDMHMDDHAGEHDDHDHAEGDADHEHADDEHADDEHAEHMDDDDHGDEDARDEESQSLGTITIDGMTLEVSIRGHIEPSAGVDIDITHTSGPEPAAVRLWIGTESGIGSLKVKAHAHDHDFHGYVEVPAELSDDAALWIEVENAAGEREVKSLPME